MPVGDTEGGVEASEGQSSLGGGGCTDLGRDRAAGVEAFLERIAASLRAGRYRPQAVLRRYIPKGDPTDWLSELQEEHPDILENIENIDILKTLLMAEEKPTNVIESPACRRSDTDDDMPELLAA